MSHFLDTSALYALLDRDDANHVEASSIWNRLTTASSSVVTSNYVVVEATALTQNRLGMKAVWALTDDLLPIVTVEWITVTDHAAAIAALRMAGRRRISLVNCTSFQLMRRMAITSAFAFDPHFQEQGFTRP